MKRIKGVCTMVVIMLITVFSFDSFAQMNTKMKMTSSTNAANELRTNMQKLWEDHITWTRLYIVSFAADLPDTDAEPRWTVAGGAPPVT